MMKEKDLVEENAGSESFGGLNKQMNDSFDLVKASQQADIQVIVTSENNLHNLSNMDYDNLKKVYKQAGIALGSQPNLSLY